MNQTTDNPPRPSAKTAKVFFPSLNGLRFIAAFVVIIHHLEQIKSLFSLPNVFHTWHWVDIIGSLGVTLFFTLSGFLITYLLLAEKERFGTIDVKAFYIRRVLRIWPLYYLIIGLGLFVLPNIEFFHIPKYTEGVYDKFGLKLLFYGLLFPNVISNLCPYMPFIAQTWSIGIEEQFYLVWPWMVKWTKHYLAVLVGIIIGLLLITNVLYYFSVPVADLAEASTSIKLINFLHGFFTMLRISCMAIGGIGAYFLYHFNMTILRPIFKKWVQLTVVLGVITMILLGVEIPFIHHEFYSVFFIIIILNLAANPDSLFNMENKIMDYLGKISYSIYMWHGVAIIFGLHAARFFNPELNTLWGNAIYYVVTFVLTLAFSAASYEWFEMQFLKFKHLFAKVQSGNLKEKTPSLLENNEKTFGNSPNTEGVKI